MEKKDQEKLPGNNYSTEQLVYANMISIEAIVNILVEKGICTRDDILNSLKEVKKNQDAYVQDLINKTKTGGN